MNDAVHKPAAAWSVMLTSVGIAVLIGVVALLASFHSHTIDARATWDAWFDASLLPFELAPVEAAEFAPDSQVLRLAPPKPNEEPPRKVAAGSARPWYSSLFGSAPAGAAASIDWTKIEARAAGDAPCEALIVRYPNASSSSAVERLFVSYDRLDAKSVPQSGGRAVLDSGELAWGPWTTRYVFEREFESGGTFRDVIRVNLSREKDAKVLFVRFPRGSSGSIAPVRELLASLTPR